MKYNSSIKNNGIMKIFSKWIKQEKIFLSEAAQIQKKNMVCTHLKVDISCQIKDNYATKKTDPREAK